MMWQDRSAIAVAEQKRWQDGSLCSVAKTLRSYDLLSFCQSKQIQGLQANKRDFAMNKLIHHALGSSIGFWPEQAGIASSMIDMSVHHGVWRQGCFEIGSSIFLFQGTALVNGWQQPDGLVHAAFLVPLVPIGGFSFILCRKRSGNTSCPLLHYTQFAT